MQLIGNRQVLQSTVVQFADVHLVCPDDKQRTTPEQHGCASVIERG